MNVSIYIKVLCVVFLGWSIWDWNNRIVLDQLESNSDSFNSNPLEQPFTVLSNAKAGSVVELYGSFESDSAAEPQREGQYSDDYQSQQQGDTQQFFVGNASYQLKAVINHRERIAIVEPKSSENKSGELVRLKRGDVLHSYNVEEIGFDYIQFVAEDSRKIKLKMYESPKQNN